MKDELGDLIKSYERSAEGFPTGDKPVIVRLDGKNFSKWTKGLAKPYDRRMVNIMSEVTTELVKYCNATIGFTQSDEITLVLLKGDNINSQIFFGGRYQKLASVLASLATYKFNKLVNSSKGITEKVDTMALFDARVFEVPDIETVAKVLDWRAEDCRRNSVSCYAQSKFSHTQLQKKSTGEMKGMLRSIGCEWSKMPDFYRNGVYVKRVKVKNKFTTDELNALPEQHHAHRNPNLEFERNVIKLSYESILDTEEKGNFILC